MRLSGLREIAERFFWALGTSKFGSLSPALARPWALEFVQELVGRLESKHRPIKDALVALDSMALTLKATQRHRCQKANGKTAGGGVIWAFMIDAARGRCPVQVLKVVAGAWNDSHQMQEIALIADGPVYLMDRGFFALKLIQGWRDRGVRFIVRSRKLVGVEVLEQVGEPRAYGPKGRIELDARARLGGPRAKAHPEVRYVQARIGKTLLRLASSEMEWSAERILDAYKKRERIEQFHRFMKEAVGMAHLYSFSHSGIMFLLHTALLLAMLLLLAYPPAGGETIAALRKALKTLRASLGIAYIWRRNTLPARRQNKAEAKEANP